MSPGATGEFAFLVACCRWPFGPAQAARLGTLADAVRDWPLVLRLARRHRVQGLVLRAVRQAGIAALPGPVAAGLRGDAIAIARTGLVQAKVSLEVSRRLAEEGIPVMILKGAPLALLAYGELTLKSAWDVDALIAPTDFPRAAALLAAAGFRPSLAFHDEAKRDHAVTADELAAWTASAKETIWHRAADGAVLELHTRLTDSPHLLTGVNPATHVRAVAVAGGGDLPTLTDPELYAYLCVHGATHAWERLKWIVDLCAFLSRYDDEGVRALHARARELGAGHCSAQALLLGRDLGLVELAPTLAAELGRSVRARAMRRLAGRVLIGGGASELHEHRFGTVPIHLSHFLISSRPTYLSRLVAAKLNAPTETIASPLPPHLRPLQPLLAVPRWLLRRAQAKRRALADAPRI